MEGEEATQQGIEQTDQQLADQTPETGQQQDAQSAPEPNTPSFSIPNDLLVQHISRLESELNSLRSQSGKAPAASQPDPYEALLKGVRTKYDDEMADSVVKPLVDRLRELESKVGVVPSKGDNAQQPVTIEQVLAQAQARHEMDAFADEMAKNGFAEFYGNRDTRFTDPKTSVLMQQMGTLGGALQSVFGSFGKPLNDRAALKLCHELLVEKNLNKGEATRALKSQLVNRNNQRSIPPGGVGTSSSQSQQATGRSAAIAAVRDMMSTR